MLAPSSGGDGAPAESERHDPRLAPRDACDCCRCLTLLNVSHDEICAV